MGLSASQARLLTLTSRLSDLELKAQQISNQKTRMSMESQRVSQDYSDAIGKQKLTVLSGAKSDGSLVYQNLNYYNLTSCNSMLSAQYALSTTNGDILVTKEMALNYIASPTVDDFLAIYGADADGGSSASADYYKNLYARMRAGYITVSNEKDTLENSTWIEDQLINGNLQLQKADSAGNWEEASYSSDASIVLNSDDVDLAKAEATYKAEMAKIESKDNKFDLQLNDINTEHSAVQTEIEAVKKVMDKNISRTFKIFS